MIVLSPGTQIPFILVLLLQTVPLHAKKCVRFLLLTLKTTTHLLA